MADVDMPDADASNPAPSKGKVAGKSAKITVPESSNDGKKRFEVKKVYSLRLYTEKKLIGAVERCSLMGLGYRGRQLRHLPESHHGSL